jgi:hypothetical protein
MPGVFELEWRDGRKERTFGHRGYYYVFPDGKILSFLPEPGRCHQCRKVTLCERLEALDEIQKELAELEDPASERSKRIALSSNPRFPQEWKRSRKSFLKHALLRTLPPSCIVCSGRHVSYFSQEWAVHPGTGEEVRLRCTGMCSTDFAMRFYDVEGNLLEPSDEERDRFEELIRKGEDSL